MSQQVTQLIYVGNECRVADPQNSQVPEWPVQDQGGHWHRSAFDGQRVSLGQNSIEFGFLAQLMSAEEVAALDMSDLPSDVFCADDHYYKSI